MQKFYCNICNKDVILENNKCPVCGTNWENYVSETNIKNSTINTENISDEKDKDIIKTFNFFLVWSLIVKALSYIISIIVHSSDYSL